MRFRLLMLAVVPALLVAAGCGSVKINESKTLPLDTNTPANALLIPAQKKPLKITVEFASSTGDVSVFVFKESDIKDNDEMAMVVGTKALASGKRGKEGSFTADIPENTATRVVVREHSAAKTDVTLKVTSAP